MVPTFDCLTSGVVFIHMALGGLVGGMRVASTDIKANLESTPGAVPLSQGTVPPSPGAVPP